MSEQKNVCPETNLVWAILCTCLCCLPLGIVAILKATSVEKLWGQERYEEARRASEDAKKYSMWGAIISAIGITLYFIVAIIVALASL
jgi:hypothetical protein